MDSDAGAAMEHGCAAAALRLWEGGGGGEDKKKLRRWTPRRSAGLMMLPWSIMAHGAQHTPGRGGHGELRGVCR